MLSTDPALVGSAELCSFWFPAMNHANGATGTPSTLRERERDRESASEKKKTRGIWCLKELIGCLIQSGADTSAPAEKAQHLVMVPSHELRNVEFYGSVTHSPILVTTSLAHLHFPVPLQVAPHPSRAPPRPQRPVAWRPPWPAGRRV